VSVVKWRGSFCDILANACLILSCLLVGVRGRCSVDRMRGREEDGAWEGEGGGGADVDVSE
jgi:hypothetical protein